MEKNKYLKVILLTIIFPIITFFLICLPFTTYLEKIFLLILTIIVIVVVLRKKNWLQKRKLVKVIYFILLYLVGIGWTLFCIMAYAWNQTQVVDRKIYNFGIYCALEQATWDNELSVNLIRYDLSGAHHIESFDYKSADCNFEIINEKDKIFLMSDCKEVRGYAHKRIYK